MAASEHSEAIPNHYSHARVSAAVCKYDQRSTDFSGEKTTETCAYLIQVDLSSNFMILQCGREEFPDDPLDPETQCWRND